MKNKIKDTILCIVILAVSFRYAFLLFSIYCQTKNCLAREKKSFLTVYLPQIGSESRQNDSFGSKPLEYAPLSSLAARLPHLVFIFPSAMPAYQAGLLISNGFFCCAAAVS